MTWNTKPSVFFILSPILLFFAAFLIYPLLYIFRAAFWIDGRFTLTYFQLIVTDANTRALVINSFKLGVFVTLMTTLVSVPLAYVFTRYRFLGRRLMQGVILVPMIMPPFVGAIGMKMFFGLYGSVNMLLSKIGLINPTQPVDWFGGGFWGVVLMATLHLYPIMYLSVAAALANIDPSLEEAAENHGSIAVQSSSGR